jgi:hypothetical protein
MKKFLFLAVSTLFMVAALTAQTTTRKTSTYHDYVNVNADEKTVTTFSTTGATLTTAQTITLASNSIGMLEIHVVGYSDSLKAAVTGSIVVRYKKPSGTLTLATSDTLSTFITDSALGAAAWSVAAVSNNIAIKVQGDTGIPMTWYITVKRRGIVRTS